MSKEVTIPNTVLCAIVKNEMQNPAGGIRNFLDAHLPYFGQAIIVDTGSKDGTLEYLQKKQEQDSRLTLLTHEFTRFDRARNVYLEEAKRKTTKETIVLSLDADELLTLENARRLKDLIEQGIDPGILALKMKILDVDLLGNIKPCTQAYHARSLIINRELETGTLPEITYCGAVGEFPFARTPTTRGINLEFDTFNTNQTPIEILHFLPSDNALKVKRTKRNEEIGYQPPEIALPPLEETPNWKQQNPFRTKYF